MKQLLSISAALAMAFSMSAFGADAPASGVKTAQQTKMGDCSKQATGKKGDEYKAFMKTCLSGSSATTPATAMTQQEKMKKCSGEAKGKKGDDYKAYMKQCLSA
jgi:hypothetical protein